MKQFLRGIYAIAILTLYGCSSSQLIQKEKGWVLLGDAKATHLREKDVIHVKSRDKFTAIRLYVMDRDVEIREVEIMLINGDALKPAVEKTIVQNERSRIIDLAADGRQLDNIKIKYRSVGKLFSKKARIQVGGKLHDPNSVY